METAMKLIVATVVVTLLTGSHQTSAAERVAIDLTQWTPPDISTVGDDPFAVLVKYGHALFTDTANAIGSEVADTSRRVAGNNLTC
jgi:thiosulfate dehydrogenase